MQILGNAVIRDRHQGVVVGAGIGGLTAAALLAKRVIQVLLIEQRTRGWSMIRATSLHLAHLAPVAVLTWRIAGGGGMIEMSVDGYNAKTAVFEIGNHGES